MLSFRSPGNQSKEKGSAKSSKRSRLAKVFLDKRKLGHGLLAGLTVPQILIGVVFALVITSLLVGYEFQQIPDYRTGDIAGWTIEAPQDFTVEDQEATFQKKQELTRTVPVVFDLDLRVNSRVETEFRRAFAAGREAIAEYRKKLGIGESRALKPKARRQIVSELRQKLPRFDQGDVLSICVEQGFNKPLEDEVVKLLQETMASPGVVLNKENLLGYQDRGVVLRNSITGQDEPLTDWMSVKDLTQARNTLRQNQFELTAVRGADKSKIISFLDTWISPNLHLDDAATQDLLELAQRDVDPVVIRVKKGKTIVRAGDEIRPRDLVVLEALKRMKQPRRLLGRFLGIGLIVLLFLAALWNYLLLRKRPYKGHHAQYLLLLLVLTVSLVITKIFIWLADILASSLNVEALQNPVHFYFVAPVAVGAILVMLLVDVHATILFTLIFSALVSLLTGETSLFLYCLTGSMAAMYMLDQYRERSAIIRAGLAIGIINMLTLLALHSFVYESGFRWTVFGVRMSAGLLSGLFAAMLASLLLPVLESLFEITTDVRLLELSNLNTPVLRRLAVEAPGTYHHSIIVGTLAETAAEAIGANSLLVRVGAYYHDIGKLKKPEYYVENQIYCGNKHETLSPSMSSLILASHVKDGLAMAGEIKLVPEVSDLIPQHHGTRLMTYFYHKARDSVDEKCREISEDDFRYPGPKPQSKEAAILMLADQVEAASRTLESPTPGQIRGLIKRLIQSTIQDGQFDECDITMKELDRIALSFERVITGMHHHRIEYPGFDFNQPIEGLRPENQRIQ